MFILLISTIADLITIFYFVVGAYSWTVDHFSFILSLPLKYKLAACAILVIVLYRSWGYLMSFIDLVRNKYLKKKTEIQIKQLQRVATAGAPVNLLEIVPKPSLINSLIRTGNQVAKKKWSGDAYLCSSKYYLHKRDQPLQISQDVYLDYWSPSKGMNLKLKANNLTLPTSLSITNLMLSDSSNSYPFQPFTSVIGWNVAVKTVLNHCEKDYLGKDLTLSLHYWGDNQLGIAVMISDHVRKHRLYIFERGSLYLRDRSGRNDENIPLISS